MDKAQKQAVLDVLNSFEVQDSQGGEECYILVESNEENLAALEEVGICRERALSYGDEELFCIASLAFDMKIADAWDAQDGLRIYSEEDMLFPLQPDRENSWFVEYKFLEAVEERSPVPVSMEQIESVLVAACELLKKRQAPANLEGMKKKFFVLKQEDIQKHLIHERQQQLSEAAGIIEQWRVGEGKKPNTYLVVNTDEPYADEIATILKRHGHWG